MVVSSLRARAEEARGRLARGLDDLDHQFLHLPFRLGIECAERLVHQQNRRVVGAADPDQVPIPDLDAPFDVFVDGTLATCEPAKTLPLAQSYMLR